MCTLYSGLYLCILSEVNLALYPIKWKAMACISPQAVWQLENCPSSFVCPPIELILLQPVYNLSHCLERSFVSGQRHYSCSERYQHYDLEAIAGTQAGTIHVYLRIVWKHEQIIALSGKQAAKKMQARARLLLRDKQTAVSPSLRFAMFPNRIAVRVRGWSLTALHCLCTERQNSGQSSSPDFLRCTTWRVKSHKSFLGFFSYSPAFTNRTDDAANLWRDFPWLHLRGPLPLTSRR